jgi:hypothetical protein
MPAPSANDEPDVGRAPAGPPDGDIAAPQLASVVDEPASDDAADDLGADDLEPVVSDKEFDARPGRPFDPEPEREKRRGQLALGAFLFLVLTVLMLMVPVIAGWRTWDDLEGVSNTVLPVVVGLVGTVSGFYFGSSGRTR